MSEPIQTNSIKTKEAKTMKFSNKQLKEIEKVFDYLAGENTASFARYANALEKVTGSRAKEMIQKVLDEHVTTFDTHRTISAVAAKLQEEEE